MKLVMRNLVTLILLAGLVWPAAALAAPAGYVVPDATVFINELHYDNTGTDAGEAIEIAGPAGTDLTGWSLVLYNGSGGAVYHTAALSGVLPDAGNGYGFVTINYPVNGIQNGSPDGMALVNNFGAVVMFLSYEGTFAATNGPALGLTSTDIAVFEAFDAPLGVSLQLTGNGVTYDDFIWASPAQSTFGQVNAGQSIGEVSNFPVSINCGSTLYTYEGAAASRTITASDPDGIVIDIAITSIEPFTAAITSSGLTPASAAGETASVTVLVDASAPVGSYTITLQAMNQDAEPQSAACSFTINVQEVLSIGEVQGETTDTENGLTDRSPYAPASGNGNGRTVITRGVIYSKIWSLSSSGSLNRGFFIQSAPDAGDGNPLTSDGIFVFHGTFSTLRKDGGGSYTPQLGDEVILRGPVVEYYNLSQLSNPYLVQVLRSGVDLGTETPAFEGDPPADLAEANRYWERHEGMRAGLAAGSLAIDGRDVFAGTADAEVWVIHPNSDIAQRVEAYSRRIFRDAHPLDDIPEELFDNGNGQRILLGSMGLKPVMNDAQAMLAPARTFDTITNAPSGGLYFSYSKYQIMVDQQIELAQGVDPALNNPPETYDRQFEYSVATYNLENLYDFRDDPTDGCDFAGNPGCPDVDPPFDYVPESGEIYSRRVLDIATQVVQDLHNPDLILVQEIEDQDICFLNNGTLECGDGSGGDGRPDALQDLAAAILALGGAPYDSAYDPDGADDRGIVSAFLFRSDRVELLPVDASHLVLGSTPQVSYRSEELAYNTDVQNPKALNAVLPGDVDTSTGKDGNNVFTRPPQVGYFRIWRDSIGISVYTDLYALSNHFSSTPTSRVGQRTEQAAYNAAIVAALQVADAGAYVTVGGDLNVYPRPDDAFALGDALFPSDQLGPLYDRGLYNLYDVLLAEAPVSAYSYIYQGQTQTLDQMFVTPALLAELVTMRAAHINADWAADYFGDFARGTSDHDPQVARYKNLPTLDRLEALVLYLDASGAIQGHNTLMILLERVAKAREFKASGQYDAYISQLYAFSDQVADFTPQFISPEASGGLIAETLLLIQLEQ